MVLCLKQCTEHPVWRLAMPTLGDQSCCLADACMICICRYCSTALQLTLHKPCAWVLQVARGAGSTGPSSSSSSHEALLAAFGPLDVCQLLVAASDLGVQHDLLDQLARMLQVS